MLQFFAKRKQRRAAAQDLFRAVLLQSRLPVFFSRYGVPDTVDGRFDLLSLHAFLIINRLSAEGRGGVARAQDFFDIMFRGLEQTNRQAGVGDLSVPRHQKRMMRALKGRSAAYAESFTSPERLAAALKRNLYADSEAIDIKSIEAMVFYMVTARKYLAAQSFDSLSAGIVNFPALDTDRPENDRPRMVA